MRVVIQRVTSCELHINGFEFSKIGKGLLVFLGIEEADTNEDIQWLCGKISGLRVFDDDQGVMNLDVKATNGNIMVVSQFTLHASTKKGNRPSYIKAARPEMAVKMYEQFIASLEMSTNRKIASGQFGAHMEIALVNDGPVTILIDSKNRE